jgi:hypothetical protein
MPRIAGYIAVMIKQPQFGPLVTTRSQRPDEGIVNPVGKK